MSLSLPIQSPFTVISGGQTGADVAGLVAANSLGIPTTGWAPKGFRTERGPQRILKTKYGLLEHSSKDYGPRTELNAQAADITFIFSTNPTSAGTVKTINACVDAGTAYVTYEAYNEGTTQSIRAYLMLMMPKVINIAGNRESKSKGLTRQVINVLKPALASYLHEVNAERITPTYRHDKEQCSYE